MIDKLDFILALAREKHFGRAAEACGVTQLQNWPGLSALTLIFVGGKHRHNWLSFEPDFIQWAKSKNCSEMRAITARKGWEPEMIERGWSEAFVIWRKPI